VPLELKVIFFIVPLVLALIAGTIRPGRTFKNIQKKYGNLTHDRAFISNAQAQRDPNTGSVSSFSEATLQYFRVAFSMKHRVEYSSRNNSRCIIDPARASAMKCSAIGLTL
jgi:hypothetical protein